MARTLFTLLLILFSVSVLAAAENKVIVLYDSERHMLSAPPTFFSIEKYDVALVGKIEEQINQRLKYTGHKAKSEKQVEEWAKHKLQNDKELQVLLSQLEEAYTYTKPAMKYGLSKVPAVVYVDGENEYIVYGETNVRKALDKINAHRVSARP